MHKVWASYNIVLSHSVSSCMPGCLTKCPVGAKIHTMLWGWGCCAFTDAILQISVLTWANVSSCLWKHSNQPSYPDFWPLKSTRLLPSHSVDIFPLLVNPRNGCWGMKIPVDQQQIVTCNPSGANNHVHSHLNSNSSILILTLNFNKLSSPQLSVLSCCNVIVVFTSNLAWRSGWYMINIQWCLFCGNPPVTFISSCVPSALLEEKPLMNHLYTL